LPDASTGPDTDADADTGTDTVGDSGTDTDTDMLACGFEIFELDPEVDFKGIHGTGDSDLWAVGFAADDYYPWLLENYVFHFDGDSWSLVPLEGFELTGPPWRRINDLWISPSQAVWGALSGGLVMRHLPCD